MTTTEAGASMAESALAALSMGDPPAGGSGGQCREDNGLLCTICLDAIPLEELATIEACGHIYCAKCILCWAAERDPCRCPQCKAPFTRLSTYRKLDGSLADFPQEEALVLLLRARWFEDHQRVVEQMRSQAPALPAEEFDPSPWQGPSAPATPERGQEGGELRFDTHGRPSYSQKYSAAYEDDDAVEAFYFSSAAGRLRVSFGNRRFGEGGYIASGRKEARPSVAAPAGPKGKGKAKAQSPPMPMTPAASAGKGKGKAALGSSPPGGASPSGQSPTEAPGPGRRARRMAKRAQQDVGVVQG